MPQIQEAELETTGKPVTQWVKQLKSHFFDKQDSPFDILRSIHVDQPIVFPDDDSFDTPEPAAVPAVQTQALSAFKPPASALFTPVLMRPQSVFAPHPQDWRTAAVSPE